MTKAMQLWPGDQMRAFFRAHIARETGLDGAAAEKLADALTRATNRMLVWDGAPLETPSSRPLDVTASKQLDRPVFNPFAFSTMVVLAKTGKDGLMKRLADIKSADNLRALADAQHLAVDPALKHPSSGLLTGRLRQAKPPLKRPRPRQAKRRGS
jgi:hypothetical protein